MHKTGFGKQWILVLGVVALGSLVASCTGNDAASTTTSESPAAENEITLTVFAAASLTDAFGAIAEGFEGANPGVTLAFNFAGSNQLAAQINEAAPVDVFASANQTQMANVVESGRVDADAPVNFVTNRLVIVYPDENPGNVAGLQDLAVPDTLIVLAAEAVPVGQYSLEFLDKASADPAFGASFREDVLANVVSYEENVRSVLTKVALGEADAGIVYTSDLVGVDGVSQIDIPDELNLVAEYPIAVLNDSPYSEMAAAFVEYVLSDAGQATLAEYGFGPGEGR